MTSKQAPRISFPPGEAARTNAAQTAPAASDGAGGFLHQGPVIITRTAAAWYPAQNCMRCGQQFVGMPNAPHCQPCAAEPLRYGARPARMTRAIEILWEMRA